MKQKDLLFILISSTFLVALWIVFGIVHNSISSTISQNTVSNLQPISSSFDVKTIQTLKTRANVNPQVGIASTPTPFPTPTIPPITPVSPLQSLSVPVGTSGGQKQ